MKTKLYGGPADGLEVDVRKPLQPQVFWPENLPVEYVEAEATPATTAPRAPIHIYELQTWRSNDRTDGRYVHSNQCCRVAG